MRFAYADPPYLGMSHLYPEHPDAARYDSIEAHIDLFRELESLYDGWAYSFHVPSMRDILDIAPRDARICAWVKPWHRMHPGARLQYGWEPVLLRPVRAPSRSVSDWVSANATMQRGLPGAKPEQLASWIFAAAGLTADDEFVDLFPGTGGVTAAWESYRVQRPLTLGIRGRDRKRLTGSLGL